MIQYIYISLYPVILVLIRISLWQFKIAIEYDPFLDDLPIENGDCPVRYIKFPEGNQPTKSP